MYDAAVDNTDFSDLLFDSPSRWPIVDVNQCGRASGHVNLQCNIYFYSRIVMDEATRIFSLQQRLGRGQCRIHLRPYQLLYNYNINTNSTYSMLQ